MNELWVYHSFIHLSRAVLKKNHLPKFSACLQDFTTLTDERGRKNFKIPAKNIWSILPSHKNISQTPHTDLSGSVHILSFPLPLPSPLPLQPSPFLPSHKNVSHTLRTNLHSDVHTPFFPLPLPLPTSFPSPTTTLSLFTYT